MRKFLLTIALLLTTSCASLPLTSEQVALLTTQIQAYTASACSFQPTAASVAALIAAFYEPAAVAVGIVNSVGDAICRAPVTAAATRRGVTSITKVVPTPKGPVVVKGATYGGSLQYHR